VSARGSSSGGLRGRGPWIAAAVLLGSAAGGFLLYRLVATPRAVLYAAPPVGQSPGPPPRVEPAESAPPAHSIPETLPPITLPGPDGMPVALSRWRGRPLLINFWAPWCEPCQREIPLLKSLRHERGADRLEIVGIAIDHADIVRKYVADHGVTYPVLIGDKGGLEAAGALGMELVLPFSVFADPAGRVVTIKVGELHRDEADLILDRLGDLDQGRLTLPAAQEQIASGAARLAAERALSGEGSPR